MKIDKFLALIIFAIIMFTNQIVVSQTIKVNAYVDTNIIEIGSQTNFYFEVVQPQNTFVEFPELNDTLTKDIEIISISKIDTSLTKDNLFYLKQKYVITSFEDSIHDIPPFSFRVDSNYFKTDSFQIGVGFTADSTFTAKIDTSQIIDIFDIKEPINIPLTFEEFWEVYGWFIIGFIILILITILIVYIVKRKKANQPIIKIEKPKEPAHIIALRKLDKLKEDKLWQKELIKEYYTELTDIMREYIENRYNIATFEKTSNEIIFSLEMSKLISIEIISKLKFVLNISDLVKFAKGLPLASDNDMCFDNVLHFVKKTLYIPKEKKEDKLNESGTNEKTTKNE